MEKGKPMRQTDLLPSAGESRSPRFSWFHKTLAIGLTAGFLGTGTLAGAAIPEDKQVRGGPRITNNGLSVLC